MDEKTLTAVSTSLALFQIQLKRHRHIRVCVRGGEPKRPEELEKGQPVPRLPPTAPK